jgi:hypothetical protein
VYISVIMVGSDPHMSYNGGARYRSGSVYLQFKHIRVVCKKKLKQEFTLCGSERTNSCVNFNKRAVDICLTTDIAKKLLGSAFWHPARCWYATTLMRVNVEF